MPVYVQHEVLGKVHDVFNAEALWQAPGLALFARRPLLRDLLERSPREQRGRAPTRCFSHVTLLLAQEVLDDDRHLTRGARVRDLAQSLKALHQKDFGDLLGSDEVRYDVIGTEALAPGEVEVRFGHAVYLPSAGEGTLYQVSTSTDGDSWEPACRIYMNQRLALLGQEAATGWPFGAGATILLVNDGPQTPIEVQVRPKGAVTCAFDAEQGHYTISRPDAATRLLMKIERVAQAPALAKPAAVWQARTPGTVSAPAPAAVSPPAPAAVPAPAPQSELTAVPFSHRPPDATFAPVAGQCVTLVALALPRLSRYRDTGALSLAVGLDDALGLCAEHATPLIGFSVNTDDQLYATTPNGREPISVPARFTPAGSESVELAPVGPAMAERYSALLMLPRPAGVPVVSGARLVFGRSAPMLAALRVLDSPRHVQCADGAASASADRIGLSRNAFSFEGVAGGFKIARISATQALYHLDAGRNLVGCIGEASADQPYLLPHGHHLVAGHYVLRFDA